MEIVMAELGRRDRGSQETIEVDIEEGLEMAKEVGVESQQDEEEPYHWRLKAACRDQMKWVKAEVWKNIKKWRQR